MTMKKAVGRDSAVRKYDLLTVLGSFALAQDRSLQRLTLRLICLITARYNWQNDQLSVAQTEMAKLWSCDPRTVKREMAALRQRGWLVEVRASGRGRAAVYALGMARILDDTRESWGNVGRDLVERLTPEPVPEPHMPTPKIIPFPQQALPVADGSLWSLVAQQLLQADQTVYRAWFAGLRAEQAPGELRLIAPSGFHARYIDTHLRSRIERQLALLAPELRLSLCAP